MFITKTPVSNMSTIFTVPVQVSKVETKADRSLKITAITATECDPLEATVLFSLANKIGHMAFKETMIQEAELADLDEKVEFKGQKTPSKLLYDRMLAYYMETHGNARGFSKWREEQLDMVGQRYLDKLK